MASILASPCILVAGSLTHRAMRRNSKEEKANRKKLH